MKKIVYVIHGWTGNPNNDWFPWIKKELEDMDLKVIIPVMPDTNNPSCQKWVDHLIKTVKKPYSHSFLVGHSLGCIAILRFLETIVEDEKVGGTLLVAGFGHDLNYEGYNNELVSFFDKPILWDKIRKHCNKFVSIHSDNDPWVPIEHSNIFKEKLAAQTHIEHNMSHFHQEAGITEVPFVLTQILRMTK